MTLGSLFIAPLAWAWAWVETSSLDRIGRAGPGGLWGEGGWGESLDLTTLGPTGGVIIT